MRLLAVTASLALLLFPACSLLTDDPDHGTKIHREHLTQHWVHSHEEQATHETEVYRPKGSKDFPFSMFRMQYVFKEGGDCEWLYLAPNDGHHFKPGTWRFDTDDQNVLLVQQGDRTVTYRIKELTDEILRMSQIETEAN